MSILQEYENIKREIGESQYNEVNRYLKFHPNILLSQVYYNKEQWDAMKWWCDYYPLEIFITKPKELTLDFMQAIHNEVYKYGHDILPCIQYFFYLKTVCPEKATVKEFLNSVISNGARLSISVSITQNDVGVFIQQRTYV